MLIYGTLRDRIKTKYNQTSQQKNFCLRRVSNIQDCINYIIYSLFILRESWSIFWNWLT